MTVKELSNAINNYNDCLKAFRDNPSNENKISLENSKRVLIDYTIENSYKLYREKRNIDQVFDY